MKAEPTIRIFLFFLLLALSGCAVHKSELPSHTPMPEKYSQADREAAAVEHIGKWWERFNDPTLNGLINEALGNNLDVAQAFARLRQFQASYQITNASSRPFLNLEAQARALRQPSTFGEDTGTSTNLSAAAGYEVDLWRKLASRSEAAAKDVLASEEEIRTIYIGLTSQLAELYFLAIEQRVQLQLTDQLIDSYQESLERIEYRYQEGLAPAQDLYQARLVLGATRARRPLFAATLKTTNNSIAILLGRFPEKELSGNLAVIPKPPAQESGLPAELLLRRPDIRAAHLRLESADAKIAAAIAERLPSINLLANLGLSTTDVPVSFSGVVWNIMASAMQPLLDGGRRRAEVERNRAAFDETLYRYQQTVLQAVGEVEDALARIKEDTERLSFLENEALSAASANERVTTEQYFQGLIDYLPVLIAQRSLVETESQTITARRQIVSDYISLMRALGGDWLDEYYQQNTAAHHKGNTP